MCIGWHRLTQEQYEEKKRLYEMKQKDKENAR